jgi:hypothetical protein
VPVKDQDLKIIEGVMRGMQTGPAAENDILELFAEDGVLVEPFTGRIQTHVGKAQLRACLQDMWKNRAPDLMLKTDRVDLDGETLRAEWTCTSTVLPGPMRGYDLFTIHQGKICRLEIAITEMPGSSH